MVRLYRDHVDSDILHFKNGYITEQLLKDICYRLKRRASFEYVVTMEGAYIDIPNWLYDIITDPEQVIDIYDGLEGFRASVVLVETDRGMVTSYRVSRGGSSHIWDYFCNIVRH